MTLLILSYVNITPTTILIHPGVSVSSPLCLVRLTSYIVNLSEFLFLQTHREIDHFFTSGVMSSESDRGFFHYRRAAFSSMIKSRVGNILDKASTLRINLNTVGSPITSKSQNHPSHSETSRLLTSSLSIGVPVPRPTQCLRGV
jgi:hypothetical protein